LSLRRLGPAAACLLVACGLLFAGQAVAGKLKTDYRIFKVYNRYLRAARDRAHAAANHRVNQLVLRYGNKNWGLDHLKAKHDWGKTLDNAIQTIVSDPKTKVRSEGGGTYRWDDNQFYQHEYCPFRVIENRNKLSDGSEKGIITAYPLPPCGVVFGP
jgi:hypothetical protein